MVRVAVEYMRCGTGGNEVGSPTSPFNNVIATPSPTPRQDATPTQADYISADRNGRNKGYHISSPSSAARPSPRRYLGKLHVRIFEGRNFAMLREPEIGCKILCELVVQGHGFESKVAR